MPLFQRPRLRFLRSLVFFCASLPQPRVENNVFFAAAKREKPCNEEKLLENLFFSLSLFAPRFLFQLTFDLNSTFLFQNLFFFLLSENLEENERIKAELNPMAIEEPKTPWHGAADSDDEEGGSAGGLGNGGSGNSNGNGGPARGISPLHEGAEGVRRFEEALAAEASFFRNRSSSNGRASTASGEIGGAGGGAGGAAINNNNSHSNGNGGNRSSGERGLSSSADADAESKRAAFEARRKAHYNMAEALRATRSESRGEPEDAGPGAGGATGGAGGELEDEAVNGGVGTRRRRQRRRVGGGEEEEEGEDESSGESSGAAAAAAASGDNNDNDNEADTMEQSNGG